MKCKILGSEFVDLYKFNICDTFPRELQYSYRFKLTLDKHKIIYKSGYFSLKSENTEFLQQNKLIKRFLFQMRCSTYILKR